MHEMKGDMGSVQKGPLLYEISCIPEMGSKNAPHLSVKAAIIRTHEMTYHSGVKKGAVGEYQFKVFVSKFSSLFFLFKLCLRI